MCSAYFVLGPPKSVTGTVGSVISNGKEVVGIDELGTADGAFELLAGGILGAAANLSTAFGTECSLS